MMKRYGLGMALMLGVVGCSGSVVHERSDPFYEGGIHYSDPIALKNTRFDLESGGYMTVVLEKVQAKDASPNFDFKIRCGLRKGLLMDVADGDTLLVTIDGQGSRYSSAQGSAGGQPAPGARRPEKPYILYDQVAADDLRAMAKGKKVVFEVRGTLHSVSGEFSKDDLVVLNEFVNSQVTGAAQ